MLQAAESGWAVGQVRDLAEARRRPSPGDATARVGMAVFLGSWLMLFAAMFFTYGLARARATVWPPLDLPSLPLLLPGLASAVIALSSASLLAAQRRLGAGLQRAAGGWLLAATALGAAFLALQLVVWVGLWRAGLRPDGGPYPSAFYGLTVLHALHVAVGLLALLWLGLRALAGRAARLAVDLWAMYWHAVGAVWLALYAAVYLT
jgi:cytochrome c oxidase subunit 3